MAVQKIEQDDFDDFVEKIEYAVICFGAPWCAPCTGFERTCNDLADSYPQVTFAKVDIEKSPQLAKDFAIRSVPFVMVMRQNTVLYAESGALNKADLSKMLDLTLAMKDEKVLDQDAESK